MFSVNKEIPRLKSGKGTTGVPTDHAVIRFAFKEFKSNDCNEETL